MMVNYYDSEFEIPDVLIYKFERDFEMLPGSGDHNSVVLLRNTVEEVLDLVAEDPEVLHEPEYLADFIRALAVRQALTTHGLLYDA